MGNSILQHVAIIPDGNRRWAKKNNLPSIQGHRYAVEHVLPELYDYLLKIKIPYCTFWAMSPENFKKRSALEVNHLLKLLKEFFNKKIEDLHSKNIQIKVIGNIEELPDETQNIINNAVSKTHANTGLTLIFAFNYGGRDEIIRAIKKMHNENFKMQSLDKKIFEKYLDTYKIPDPDLIIRTGGEKRTSGFLLWQSEYAEYAFIDKLFPEFTTSDLQQCLDDFSERKRRFGK